MISGQDSFIIVGVLILILLLWSQLILDRTEKLNLEAERLSLRATTVMNQALIKVNQRAIYLLLKIEEGRLLPLTEEEKRLYSLE